MVKKFNALKAGAFTKIFTAEAAEKKMRNREMHAAFERRRNR
jgi:hypothetical protein